MAKDKETVSSEGTAPTAVVDRESEEAAEAAATTTKKPNKSPTGQTAASSGILGGSDGEDDFTDEDTRIDPIGQNVGPTRIGEDGKQVDKDAKVPKEFVTLAKALGLKSSNILGHNERSRTVVFDNGGKYQLDKKGKNLRHLSGPPPPKDLDLNVQDARQRSGLTGTAAALNQPAVVVATDPSSLREERSALRARIKEINGELKGDDEE